MNEKSVSSIVSISKIFIYIFYIYTITALVKPLELIDKVVEEIFHLLLHLWQKGNKNVVRYIKNTWSHNSRESILKIYFMLFKVLDLRRNIS